MLTVSKWPGKRGVLPNSSRQASDAENRRNRMGLFSKKEKAKSFAQAQQSQTQQSQAGLADFLTPDVQGTLGLARQAALAPTTLQGQLVAGLDRNTLAGLAANRQGANQIAPILAQQRQGLSDTLSGKYTDPASNPFFEGVADFVRSQVTPAVDSRFAASGAFGSPLHQIGLAEGITQQLAPHLFSAYQQERGFQNDAINNAAGIAGENATTRGSILERIGAVLQGQEQAELDANVYRQQYDADQRRAAQDDYTGTLGEIAKFFTNQKATATAQKSERTKSVGKSKGGVGLQLINLGQQLGGKVATGGAGA
ncbi:MAG: hypothetical protein AAF543_22820 [Pseudomonadota bacterium]